MQTCLLYRRIGQGSPRYIYRMSWVAIDFSIWMAHHSFVVPNDVPVQHLYRYDSNIPEDHPLYHHYHTFHAGGLTILDDPEQDFPFDDDDPDPDPEDEFPPAPVAVIAENSLLKIATRRYDVPHDVEMRLNNSVLRYDGVPVFIKSIPNSLNVNLFDLSEEGKPIGKADSSDPRLDITSPPLGFGFGEKHNTLFYFSRIPWRQQKQGLCNDNVEFRSFYIDRDRSGTVQSNINRGFTTKWQPFKDAIEGKYKSIPTIVAAIRDGVIGLPFDRSFALVGLPKQKAIVIQCKNIHLGYYLADEGRGLLIHRPELRRVYDQLSQHMNTELIDEIPSQPTLDGDC